MVAVAVLGLTLVGAGSAAAHQHTGNASDECSAEQANVPLGVENPGGINPPELNNADGSGTDNCHGGV